VRRLLLLYPRAWRERYQPEMEAVLDGMPFDLRAALDLVACAADAHLHPLRGGRPRAPLPLQLALLAGLAMLAFPPLEDAVEGLPALHHAGVAYSLAPVAVPLAGAVLGWRARWGLAAWFCALFAVQGALANGALLSALPFIAERPLEPIRLAAAGLHPGWFRLLWPFTAAMILGAGALAALVLRRLGTPWPAGLAIGVALLASTDIWAVYAFAGPALAFLPGHPHWFRLAWLVDPAQVLAWGALTAALLRRAGLAWWAGLPAGCVLWLLLSPKFGPGFPPGLVLLGMFLPLWQLPALAWAIVVAGVAVGRGADPAPREAVPC
jgi:hypothetical protein